MDHSVSMLLGALSIPGSSVTTHFGKSITDDENQVAVIGMQYVNGVYSDSKVFILINEGEWKDAQPSVQRSIPVLYGHFPRQRIQFLSSTELAISGVFTKETISNGRIYQVSARDESWEEIETSVIYGQNGVPSSSTFGMEL